MGYKKFEKEYAKTKDWEHLGETNNTVRPKNSLLNVELDFKQKKPIKNTKEDEYIIDDYITKAIRNKEYSNITFGESKKEELIELSVSTDSSDNEIEDEIENIENIIDKLKNEIMVLTDYNLEMLPIIEKDRETKQKIKIKDKKDKDMKKIKAKLSKNKNVKIMK